MIVYKSNKLEESKLLEKARHSTNASFTGDERDLIKQSEYQFDDEISMEPSPSLRVDLQPKRLEVACTYLSQSPTSYDPNHAEMQKSRSAYDDLMGDEFELKENLMETSAKS